MEYSIYAIFYQKQKKTQKTQQQQPPPPKKKQQTNKKTREWLSIHVCSISALIDPWKRNLDNMFFS